VTTFSCLLTGGCAVDWSLGMSPSWSHQKSAVLGADNFCLCSRLSGAACRNLSTYLQPTNTSSFHRQQQVVKED